MQVVDPLNLPTHFLLSEARKADPGQHPRLLDGFLYVGLTVLYSEPGLGKSMLAGQTEEHLAYGRPFGHWVPDHPVRCLVIDLEGDMRLAAERSLTNTPFGLLPSDHGRPSAADVHYETEWVGGGYYERAEALAQRLENARENGQPFEYVRVDTLKLFLGSKPHGANAYDWEASCLRHLNKMALHFGVALVLIHHTNKSGEVSGSTGIAGSATCIAQIKRNPDNDDECVLISHKIRVDEPFRYAMMMDERGRWEFTEAITPTQAQLTGTKRAVVDLLTARGPLVIQDLRDAMPGTPVSTIKTALKRLRGDGIARYTRARWELTAATLADHPACQVCGDPMEAYAPGQTTHPTCMRDPWESQTLAKYLGDAAPAPAIPEQPAPAPADDVDQDDEDETHPEAQRFPGFAMLKESVSASRMKPLPRVPKEERDGKPWSLITEKMDGAHQSKHWRGEAPEGTQLVVVLDRNGSFPSAMSSVPVAPNKLIHTGPLGADPLKRGQAAGIAGIFQIHVPEWTEPGMPHPLGRLAYSSAPGEPVWVTGSHLEFLDRLAKDGVLPVVDVLDSWTGRRNTSLFERFYQWARTVRSETAQADPEVRTDAKRAISTAIRSLHPKQAKSPFYRPDWHKAVVAQASVRHWATAWRAVQGGAQLLSIGATDEVAFAVPADADAPKLWVPTPYRIGAQFGQVKHKEIKTGGEMVMSPVTLDQWVNRGR